MTGHLKIFFSFVAVQDLFGIISQDGGFLGVFMQNGQKLWNLNLNNRRQKEKGDEMSKREQLSFDVWSSVFPSPQALGEGGGDNIKIIWILL